MSGGNCWDNSVPQAYTSNDKPEDLGILDAILEKVCPDINFLKYKKLYDTLTKYDTRTESQYYGNSSDFANKTIYIKELYQYLVDEKYIEE